MVKIEHATLKDVTELASLFDQYRVFYKKPSDIEAAKKFLKDRIQAFESVIYVAYADKNVMVGFTQLYPVFSSTRMKRLWLLNDLFVDPLYRGKGISLALIEKTKEMARQTGACGVMLETARTNEIGNRLYPKAGFTVDKDHNYYSWDN
jgi:GNAT superfamily N-acetyltransferase